MSDASREAAAAMLGDAATDEVEQPTDPGAEAEAQPVDELPDDILADLEGPDLDEDDDEPVEPLGEIEDPDEEAYLEPAEAAKLRKRAREAEKRSAWLEKQRVQSERKKWVAEAKQFFPYAEAEKIDAESRRAFRRQAKAEHDRIKDRVDAVLAEEKAKVTADEKQQLREGFGSPVETPGHVPQARTAAAAEQRQRALSGDRLDIAVKARLSDPDDPLSRAFGFAPRG